MELYIMSNLELTRLDFIKQHLDCKLTQAHLSDKLNLSIRQIQRLVRNYKDIGYEGLISKKRGKPSNNFIPFRIKANILEIIHKHYSDFGPTLVSEKLSQFHNYKFLVETIRKWMIEFNLWIPRKQRLKSAY